MGLGGAGRGERSPHSAWEQPLLTEHWSHPSKRLLGTSLGQTHALAADPARSTWCPRALCWTLTHMGLPLASVI